MLWTSELMRGSFLRNALAPSVLVALGACSLPSDETDAARQPLTRDQDGPVTTSLEPPLGSFEGRFDPKTGEQSIRPLGGCPRRCSSRGSTPSAPCRAPRSGSRSAVAYSPSPPTSSGCPGGDHRCGVIRIVNRTGADTVLRNAFAVVTALTDGWSLVNPDAPRNFGGLPSTRDSRPKGEGRDARCGDASSRGRGRGVRARTSTMRYAPSVRAPRFLLVATSFLGCSSESVSSPAESAADVADTGVRVDAPLHDGGEDASSSETAVPDGEAPDGELPDGGVPDAELDATSDADEPVDPLTCNSLVLEGDEVLPTLVAEALPTLAGGTIADGTYVLTELVSYTGVGGPSGPGTGSVRSVVRIGAGTYEERFFAKTESASTGTMTQHATTVTLARTCPGSDSSTVGFEATPTSLRLAFDDGGGGGVVYTYTKK